jgi:hypothetical protein
VVKWSGYLTTEEWVSNDTIGHTLMAEIGSKNRLYTEINASIFSYSSFHSSSTINFALINLLR